MADSESSLAAHEPGSIPYTYWLIQSGHAEAVEGGLVDEGPIGVYVNGQDLVTLMCSPLDQEALALGFLYNEGVIASFEDVALIQANVARTTVDVFLTHARITLPRRMILTSGCGGGVTFQTLAMTYLPVTADFVTTPEAVVSRMRDLQGSARLYRQVRGIHTSILADADSLVVSAEDIGRHNTVDKLAGKALQQGIDMTRCMLLTSGRISSEMLAKARQMGVSVVASRTAPTSLAIRLAQAWNVCVVGYVRQDSLRVYTHPYRLNLEGVTGHTIAP